MILETEQEEDGRWIAEIVDLPGVMAYGATRRQAIRRSIDIALDITWPSTLNGNTYSVGCAGSRRRHPSLEELDNDHDR